MNTGTRRELARKLGLVEEEIAEGFKYGIPHIVGEILEDGSVFLSVVVFESARHSFLLRESDRVFFLYPAEERNRRRLFFKLWRFLDGREEDGAFVPGKRIGGILKNALRREGFDVLWINVRPAGDGEYIDVWAVKDGTRYNLLFEKIAQGEYVLLEMEKV
ncbi:hypothetical protein [Thermococcus sp. MV11]|uniref:hypothetical protein n=1 Tax=Thermococcus sp. MV11 TaxID=1638267 RepID=UPI001431E0D1|nr:hypothetical protein [Thermococcus sp. MV11]NJE04408.1 hypothetical protein [Thermococcus sp. MV11]